MRCDERRNLYIACICRAMIMLFVAMIMAWPDSARAIFVQKSTRNITSPRPVYDMCDMLESMYGLPVTYEDPVYVWAGDLTQKPPHPGLYLKERSVNIPMATGTNLVGTKLQAGEIGRILELYHQQSDGPRFRILASRWGYHILPQQVRDRGGKYLDVTSPLDKPVEVAVAERTASEHFKVLCDALTKAAGTMVKPLSNSLEAAYAINGVVPSRLATESDIVNALFAWGAKGVTGREALISFLELSGTTLTWRLWSNPEPWDQYYILIVKPISVRVTDTDGNIVERMLLYDRCKQCPPFRVLMPPKAK